ncbi:MAG: DUF3105 domain-containing protein [Solirubrobacteraceae bacterium]
MASREEEKRKRREEREAQERAKQQAGKRGRLVLIGGAIAAAIVVVIVGVVLATGSDDDHEIGKQAAAESGGSPIPEQQEKDFNTAVKAAGCTFTEHPNEGATHQSEPFTDYKTNPPTSGTHDPEPAADGVYEAGNSPDPNNWVHTLEHGRVIIQYKPGTSEERIAQLKTLTGESVNGSPGYHMVLMENTTDMPYEVAAVSWTRTLGCEEFTGETFDAIRVFRDRWIDKAPELVP